MNIIQTIFCCLMLMVLAACSDSEQSLWRTSVLVPNDAVPLSWNAADTLVVGYGQAIYQYDLGSHKLKQRLAEQYDATDLQHSNCFSSQGGRFNFPTKKLSRHIPDWSRPDLYRENPAEMMWWNTNPLDCSPFNYEDREGKIAKIEGNEKLVRSPRPLLLPSDGDSFVALEKKTASLENRELYLFGHNLDHPTRTIPLISLSSSAPDIGSEIRSFRDPNGSYVIYESNRDFDADHQVWPLNAWRLAPDLSVKKVIILPTGPWIRPHGFFKQFSCFSCGCSCYAHFDLTGANGHIYAHVYGESVEESDAGVYELIQKRSKSSWIRRIPGNFDGPIITSPEGCRIVYSDQERKLRIGIAKSCQ